MRPELGRLSLGLVLTLAQPAAAVEVPETVDQGALVRLCCFPGQEVRLDERRLRVSAEGSIVFGVARDRLSPLQLAIGSGGQRTRHAINVQPRTWPSEVVDGVPPATVEPPPAIARRIAAEQARVVAARQRDDDRADFIQRFRWPVSGRISGQFGAHRVYNGKPGSAHSGLDIAAPSGTPIHAPAAGVVSFADSDLYLTGGTVLLDHGHGVSSVFLHLSRIDVRPGQRVEQGEVLGAVGATGRATGPHLHWGLNWFDTRLDPASVLPEASSP